MLTFLVSVEERTTRVYEVEAESYAAAELVDFSECRCVDTFGAQDSVTGVTETVESQANVKK